ncbi:MAG TPA: tripartite tricarboxylate transporter substrate binding protein [Burkholderiales bacterium]|nr:tripartite tricarboxylate transporter substrate binding protein [Burkholderiales bacterium]
MNSFRMAAVCAACVTSAAMAAQPGAAARADYPSRPIRLVSPNPPGGANDVIGRVIASRLGEVLGMQVVVDNRGGAGGTIGGEIVAHANPDGYTLLAGSVSTHSFNPIIHKKLGYDPLNDFAPISLFAIAHNLLVSYPGLPASNVRELIALAKAKPGALNYASGGTGSTSHFAIAMFVSLAGIAKDTVHVPYKGGAPSVTATIAGETQFYFGPMASMVPQVKAGRLKALAVGSAKRSATLPDVPTVAESGVPAYKAYGWFGLLAPAGTPRAIIARLNKAVVDAVSSNEAKQQLIQVGAEAASTTPEEFDRFIREQLELHRKIVKDLGIKFD